MLLIERHEANKIIKKLRNLIINYNLDENGAISFVNEQDGINGTIALDRVSLFMGDKINVDTFYQNVKNFLTTTSEILEIDRFNRFGFRIQQSSLEESKEVVLEKCTALLKIKQKELNNLGALEGIHINFNVSNQFLKANIQIVPGEQHFVNISAGRSPEVKIEHGVTFDVDIFVQGLLRKSDVHNFSSNSVKFLRETIYPFINSIGDE